jgi:hypothetical protein
MEAALNRRPPNREYHRKLDGEQEARLIALACSEPPEGQARWSLRLLADRMVELEVVEEISYQTVRRTLKKRTEASSEQTVVHPTTLQRRIRAEDGRCARGLHPSLRSATPPEICMDETSKQLLRDTKEPLPMEPAGVERTDYEYERGGVVKLFLFCANRYGAGAGWM